ncbi:MAG: hypothetical protein RL088_1830 [Verrucomicrobiota bacterium]|jgi:uncharacterized protein (TIGR00730 family)
MNRICVYCGSLPGNRPEYTAAAAQFGAILARRGIGLVYGGGNIGLMGAVASAVLKAGGEVIGVIPVSLMEKELGLRECTELRVVQSMHERKQTMVDLSDAFVALPGGIGTYEELFETFTWQQLAFHDKPVGLLNVAGFYDHLLGFLKHATTAEFLRPEHCESLLVDTDGDMLLDRMAGWRPPRLGKWWNRPNPEQR